MIDARLLQTYIAELEALRAHGREFAQTYPDIAGRLDIGPRRSRDPHVERVIESAAFLAARLRLAIDSAATELPLSILTVLAPSLVEPVPSMALAELAGGMQPQKVPRGSRFDGTIAGRPICFQTTMPIVVTTTMVRTEVREAGIGYASGIDVHIIRSRAPDPLVLYVGSDDRTSAVLMDAMDSHLVSLAVVMPDGKRRRLSPQRTLHVEWLSSEHAMLPARRAAHPAHRNLTEFLVFPDKFRFITLRGVDLPPDSILEFRFRAPLALSPPIPPDLISVNRVPMINLWSSAGAPINVDGRQLEYPVTVDTVRYRTVNCHSVEEVELVSTSAKEPEIIDPVVALGEVRGSKIRWGVRRAVSREGSEVMLYFQGLDYREVARERLLAIPKVLASNRDMAQHLQTGATLMPQDGLGLWQGRLVMPPTPPLNEPLNEQAMMYLIGFLRSGISGLIADTRSGALRDFLKSFPGGERTSWINSLGGATLEPVTALRRGQPQAGVAVRVHYDAADQPTTSRATVRRVLSQLFESQRGLNRVEEMHLDAF